MFVHITGTGSYLPTRVVTNAELAEKLDTTDEWIFSHTGIRSRHLGADDETTSSMAIQAGRAALEAAGVRAEELGMIVVATSTSDYQAFPSTACLVQHALGATQAAAFDLQAACTGFIYALWTVYGLMQVDPRPTLVIGAEMMSRIVDWTDRNSCILFGMRPARWFCRPAGSPAESAMPSCAPTVRVRTCCTVKGGRGNSRPVHGCTIRCS